MNARVDRISVISGEEMKRFADKYLFGASMGAATGCLIGVAILPLYGVPWFTCIVGAVVMSYIAQVEGRRYFGEREGK